MVTNLPSVPELDQAVTIVSHVGILDQDMRMGQSGCRVDDAIVEKWRMRVLDRGGRSLGVNHRCHHESSDCKDEKKTAERGSVCGEKNVLTGALGAFAHGCPDPKCAGGFPCIV